MNEISISFNLPNNTTVEQHSTKTISILSTEHECSNFTVILSYMADGTKLPSVIIFKLVNVPQEEFSDRVIVRTNSQGWMNENEMSQWVENVWTQRARQGSNSKSLLVLDSFTAHKTNVIKCRFYEKNTDLAIILGWLTSRLQPLNISLNKSFKAKVFYFILFYFIFYIFYYLNKLILIFLINRCNNIIMIG